MSVLLLYINGITVNSFFHSTCDLRFITVVARIGSSFLFCWAVFTPWIYHSLIVHSFVLGHLGYFKILAFMNKLLWNSHTSLPVSIYFHFLGYIPTSGTAESMGKYLTLSETSKGISKVVIRFFHFHWKYMTIALYQANMQYFLSLLFQPIQWANSGNCFSYEFPWLMV